MLAHINREDFSSGPEPEAEGCCLLQKFSRSIPLAGTLVEASFQNRSFMHTYSKTILMQNSLGNPQCYADQLGLQQSSPARRSLNRVLGFLSAMVFLWGGVRTLHSAPSFGSAIYVAGDVSGWVDFFNQFGGRLNSIHLKF